MGGRHTKKQIAGLILLLTALVAGCSTASPASPDGAPPQPPQSGSGQASRPDARTLNDQAFRLLQEKKWAESAAVSRQVIAQDATDSAAWFNLGKAQVGAGNPDEAVNSFRRASALSNGSNADVQYNLAKALGLAGETKEALALVDQAIKQFPGDKDFVALRAQVQNPKGAKPEEKTFQADLDGDGRPDTFVEQLVAKDRPHLKVTSASGNVLYEGDLMGWIHNVRIFQMPDGTRLAHLEVEGCPSNPQNHFLAFSPVTKQVTDPWGKGDMCAYWSYKENGRFTTWYRLHYVVTGVTERRWADGQFTAVRLCESYMMG